jgi:diguanylate cyclase (GGDEF)-like protein
MNIEYRTKRMYANIGKLITSSLEIHEIVDGVMAEIKSFFNPEHWSLMRLDHTSDELYFIYIQGHELDKLKQFRLKSGEGIAGAVAKTGESVFVPDVKSDLRFSDRVDRLIDFKTRSIIAVPLIHRGTVYGVVEIVNSENAKQFSEDDHFILRTIADFTAIAFANSSLYHKVIDQSCHDSLTGLLNRKMLNDYIDQWTEEDHPARRYSDIGEEIIVIYMDINNFKSINDNYGHREGDTALVHISEMLKNIFRNEDLLFRIGGDEFLAVIRINTKEDTEHITGRIDEAFKNVFYTSPDGAVRLTVSHGINKGPVTKIEALMNEADLIMYEKKQNPSGNS